MKIEDMKRVSLNRSSGGSLFQIAVNRQEYYAMCEQNIDKLITLALAAKAYIKSDPKYGNEDEWMTLADAVDEVESD